MQLDTMRIFCRKISKARYPTPPIETLFPAHPVESLLLSATHSSPPSPSSPISLYPAIRGIEPRSLTVPSYPPRRNPLSPLFSLPHRSLRRLLHLRIFVAGRRPSRQKLERGSGCNWQGRQMWRGRNWPWHVRSWTEGRIECVRASHELFA